MAFFLVRQSWCLLSPLLLLLLVMGALFAMPPYRPTSDVVPRIFGCRDRRELVGDCRGGERRYEGVGWLVLARRDWMEFESNRCHVFVCNVIFLDECTMPYFLALLVDMLTLLCLFLYLQNLWYFLLFKPGSDACLDRTPRSHPPTRRTLTLFVNWVAPNAICLPFHPEPGFTEKVKPTIFYIHCIYCSITIWVTVYNFVILQYNTVRGQFITVQYLAII